MSSPNSPHTVESGGPAFPTEPNTQSGFYVHHGMSLRDYYAGQAASSMVAAFSSGGWHNPCEYQLKSIAKASWALADALLESRARATGEN